MPKSNPSWEMAECALMAPSFSVVIPTFRRPHALELTLRHILEVDYPPDAFEVIVVDDGSGDETAAVVERHVGGRTAVTYAEQANSGAAAARNRGARVATGDMVLFLDDDILVERTHLQLHAATHDRFDRALVNGEWRFTPETLALLQTSSFGRYRIALEDHFREEAPARPLGDDCLQCEVLPAPDLSMERELFWEIGGFDEAFPAAGAEDQEFSYRARQAGCLLVRNPTIRLLHNDAHVSLESFCRREERRAVTVVVLARRFPQSSAALDYSAANSSLSRSDPPMITLKKLFKIVAAQHSVLPSLIAVVHGLERVRAPDALLARAYSVVAGLYIFRGFRSAQGPIVDRPSRRLAQR
jgi:GT2 family glycosyltransferase